MELILNNVRIAFPKIWEPEQFNGTGKARCSASLIMEAGSAEIKKVMDAIQGVKGAVDHLSGRIDGVYQQNHTPRPRTRQP